MAERDPASNLEFWSDRKRAGDELPQRARRPYRRSRFDRVLDRLPFRVPAIRLPEFHRPGVHLPTLRARPVAAGLLLAALAGAWLMVGHESHGSAAVVPPVTVATSTSASNPPTTVAPPKNAITLPVVTTDGCKGLSVRQPHVRCAADHYVQEVALYAPATLGSAFRRIAGGPQHAHTGPSVCAAGHPDERAWSLASAPTKAVGRYLCRLEGGRAAIWWTHGDRLWHALANDADLATLFSQWSAHPSE